ncbi:MAG: glycosyltransferase family 2 protein [Myxococcota bacterium]
MTGEVKREPKLAALDLADGRILPAAPGAADGEIAFGNPRGDAQGYFRVERPHELTNRALVIEFDVRADAKNRIRIDYDSTDRTVRGPGGVPGAFKATADQKLPASGGWQHLRFALSDARFFGALHGADFRVVSRRAEPLVLRAVRVSAADAKSDSLRAAPAAPLAFAENAEPRVSIVIPIWNRLELTLDCLRALRAHTEGSFEVIVVDDGSSPKAETALGGIPGLRLRRFESNRGFACACNAGAALARGREIVFLNNDTLPEPGWLAPLVAACEKDARVGVAGSLLLYPVTREVQHAGIEFADGVPFHRFRYARADAPEVARSGVVPAVTGACLLTPREVFERLGGFDECYQNGYEDIDFCLRVRDAGGLVYYCAESVLLHHESATPGRIDPPREKRNLEYLLEQWRR